MRKNKRIYHVGLLAKGNAAILQYRENIDNLSCEILEYLGKRETTKTRVKQYAKELKIGALAELNRRYPKRNFNRIVID